MRDRFDEDALRALFEEVEAPPGVGRWRFRGAAPARPALPSRARRMAAMAACVVAVLAVVGGVSAAVRLWGTPVPASSTLPGPAGSATPSGAPASAAHPSAGPTASAAPSSPAPPRGGGQPGRHNTGVPAGIQLYRLDLANTTSFRLPAANTSPTGCAYWNGQGEVVIDRDNCTVQGIDNPGSVTVVGRNAVVRNSRIVNTAGGGYPTNGAAYFAIQADQAVNLQVIGSELAGGQHCIRGASFTLVRVNAYGCGRIAHVGANGSATITESWLHDVAGSGYVIFEDGAVGPVVIEGSYLDGRGPDVAAVLFTSGGSRGNHTIRGCWLSGGEEMLVVNLAGGGLSVTDTRFYPTYTRSLIQRSGGSLAQSNNTWAESGTTPDRGRVSAGQAVTL